MFKIKEPTPNKETYTEALNIFQSTYALENPATKMKEREKFSTKYQGGFKNLFRQSVGNMLSGLSNENHLNTGRSNGNVDEDDVQMNGQGTNKHLLDKVPEFKDLMESLSVKSE